MRTLFRLLLSAGLLVIALGAAPGSAAAASAPATVETIPVEAEWCHDNGFRVACTEIDGHARVVVFADGDSFMNIAIRAHTVYTRNGVVVGEESTTDLSQTRFGVGGEFVVHSVVHTHIDRPDETCTITTVMRFVDWDRIVVDRVNAPDCH